MSASNIVACSPAGAGVAATSAVPGGPRASEGQRQTGGRDQVTVQLGGRTVTGTLTTGDITTS